MKRDLEKIAAADFMLQQFNVGRWCIEIHEQQKPCLYADDIFWNMMGMPKDLAPEEAFSFWEQQIPEYEKKRTSDYFKQVAHRHQLQGRISVAPSSEGTAVHSLQRYAGYELH